MAVSTSLGSLGKSGVAVLNACHKLPVAAHRLSVCVELLKLSRLGFMA